MNAYALIKKKRDGKALSREELAFLINGYLESGVKDYQISAFLMAVFFRGMLPEETAALTDVMLRSGRVMDWSALPGKKVDKHSTGGVGDKVSLLLAPLVASAGVYVPMMSGRGLGHTGGTLDKLAAIPGMRTSLSEAELRDCLVKHGMAFVGQTEDLVPADRELYALRDVTGTVECLPLIASSIMSKKLAEGVDGLVLDVKVGSGAFMKDLDSARQLAGAMIDIGRSMGKQIVACLTDMDQPLGTHVGNSLEVHEAAEAIQGRGPEDLRELSLVLGAWMLVLAGKSRDLDDAKDILRHKMLDGSGFRRLQEIVEAQGGDPRALVQASRLPRALHQKALAAPRSGYVASIQTEALGTAAVALGAGRARKEDAIDYGVGFVLRRKRGEAVKAGEPLLEVHYNDERRCEEALRMLEEAYRIGDAPPAPVPLIHEVLGGEPK